MGEGQHEVGSGRIPRHFGCSVGCRCREGVGDVNCWEGTGFVSPNHTGSSEDISRLWDRYVQVSRKYKEACRATDAAQAACEAAFAVEARWGREVVTASQAFAAASDAAFLNEVGISIR